MSNTLELLQEIVRNPRPEVAPTQQMNREYSLKVLELALDYPELKILETTHTDGITLRSFYFQVPPTPEHPEQKIVLHLSPGGSRNAASLVNLAYNLTTKYGIPVCVTDYAGQGFSEGTIKNKTIKDMRDETIQVLQTHFAGQRLIVAGHSKGGTVSENIAFQYILNRGAYKVAGHISIASGAMNPIAEILRNGWPAIKAALNAFQHGVTLPIPFFTNQSIDPKELEEMFKAFGSTDSLKIASGTPSMKDEYAPTPAEIAHFKEQTGEVIPAQLVHIENDTVFSLKDDWLKPGSINRMRRWQQLGIGPAGLIYVDKALGHSISTLYPAIMADYVAQAYTHIVEGTTGQGENALPPETKS